MAGRRVALFDRARRRGGQRRSGAAVLDLAGQGRLRRLARAAWLLLVRGSGDAGHRSALPGSAPDVLRRPLGSDWGWRPDLWRALLVQPGFATVAGKTPLAEGVTLFHDCPRGEVTLRQIRNADAAGIAPFGVRLEVFRFDGSFLSLALDLPEEAVRGLLLRHLIRLDVVAELASPLRIYARLNVRHGPNLAQVVREMQMTGGAGMVEFDLACTRMNERRVAALWVDLIFEAPAMNWITLRDVTLSRRPRAEV